MPSRWKSCPIGHARRNNTSMLTTLHPWFDACVSLLLIALAADVAHLWRLCRAQRRELDVTAAVMEAQHDAMLRLACQVHGRRAVERALEQDRERGRN